jgi:putative MATE family efflux protein
MLRLALPVLAEQFLVMLVGFSDTILTGHYLAQPHLAAITLISYLLWLAYGLFSVVAIGATALIARFVGAGRHRLARRVANQALLVGAAVAAVAMLTGFWLADRAVLALQLEGEAAVLATRFVHYILLALPMVMLEAVGIACLRGAGDMISGLGVMAVVNAVNVAVSWLLVPGLGPLPRLGWEGLAIGTTCGYTAGGLLVLALLLRGRSGLQLHWRWLRPNTDLIRRLLRIGLPGGVDTLSVIGCQLWFLAVINQLGDLAAAAHGVAIRVESLAYLPGLAFQMAATTLAGQYLGAKEYQKARHSVLMALLVGGGMMVAAGAVFYVQAYPLACLLLGAHQEEVARQAVPLLKTISLGMPALALTMILTGALRGAGDTRWPLLFTMIGFLGVRLPAAYWLAFPSLQLPGTHLVLAGWGLGVLGAWYAMVSDLGVRASLVLYRFWQGGWTRVEV